MKFKKPSEQNVTNTAVMTGGALLGGGLSRGIFGALHTPTTATDAAAIKKDQNTAMLKRAGLVVAGVAAAMFVDGSDTGANAVKGAGIGIAVVQGLELVKVLAERNGVASETAASTTGKKFLARTVGLGCACSEQRYGMGNPAARTYVPRFNYEAAQEMAKPVNQLEAWANAA